MPRILLTGIATLDIINQVDHYPMEDEELRASSQQWMSGGNAANTAKVLTQLGNKTELASVLALEPNGDWIREELAKRNIGLGYIKLVKGKAPVSYITLNQHNGSRTIIHYRDLPEYLAQDFTQIPLDEFDWLHFEGRNIEQTEQMLDYVRRIFPNKTVSLEVEKERDGIDRLFPKVNTLIFSKSFVIGRGFQNAESFLNEVRSNNPEPVLICSWGEQGAWAMDSNQQLLHVPASTQLKVIDTIGAGDTFNAAIIHSLNNKQPLIEALTQACTLAGKKVAQSGFDNLI